MADYTIRFGKWFAGSTPVNAKKSSLVFTEGEATLTVRYKTVGPDGNSYSASVVVATGLSQPMSVAMNETELVITLATTAAGAADSSKNTFALISAAINGLGGALEAVYSGSGKLAANAAEANLTDGKFATVSGCAILIDIAGVHYTCDKAVSKFTTDGWKSATPATV